MCGFQDKYENYTTFPARTACNACCKHTTDPEEGPEKVP